MVPLHRPRPWSLDLILAVFPEGASQPGFRLEYSPHGLDLSRRVPLDARSRCLHSDDDAGPKAHIDTVVSAASGPEGPSARLPPEGDSPHSLAGVVASDLSEDRPAESTPNALLANTTGPSRGDLWLRAPLVRFFRPFSASGWLRPLPHRLAGSVCGVACRFVPSSSFRRPRRFAPQSIPVRVSPHNTHGVRLTLQGFPPREGRSVSGATCPS